MQGLSRYKCDKSTATDYLIFAYLSETKNIFKFESVIVRQMQVVSST